MSAKTVTQHLRDRLLAGVITSPVGDKAEPLHELAESQWCPEFEQHMRARLLIGRYHYGCLRRQQSGDYDKIGSAVQRLHLYRETGNLEHLVDVANLCLVEFVTGDHSDKHFSAADDGVHVVATSQP